MVASKVAPAGRLLAVRVTASSSVGVATTLNWRLLPGATALLPTGLRIGGVGRPGPEQSLEWVPRPSKVSTAKPSHSVAGSYASFTTRSPTLTVALRRRVLSAVDVTPLPHSEPGSTPTWPMLSRTVPEAPPTRSTTASSPENVTLALVMSAAARMPAAAELLASTNTSCDGIVPARLIMVLAVELPLA